MRFGPFEIMILLAIFFLLFGAERLPKLARAAGQSKGEFQKGLSDVTGEPSSANTEADLEAGGKTKAVEIAQKAEAAGIDPSGKTAEEVADEIASAEE
jgi:sec-independent protein translocase protein TatA